MSIKLMSIKSLGKRIVSAFVLSTLLFQINAYALDQVLTTPNPSFVENKLQTGVNFAMNSMMLGKNVDYQGYTSIVQHLKLSRSKLGGFIFKLQRTAELEDGKTPEKIMVSLEQGGQIIASELLEGVSSATSPEDVKWIFPDGINITPNMDLKFIIQIDDTEFTSLDADTPTTVNTFPYYTIGTSYLNGVKPEGFGILEFFDGANTVMTESLLNLVVIKKEANELNVTLPSKYKYPLLVTQDSTFLNNISDIKVISNVSTSNISSQCSALTTGTNSNVYRPITEAEAEKLVKNSELLYGLNGLFDVSANPSMGGVFSSNGAELITPTKAYKFAYEQTQLENQVLNGDFENTPITEMLGSSYWMGGSQTGSYWRSGNSGGATSRIQSDVVKSGRTALHLKLIGGGYNETKNNATFYYGTAQSAIKPNTKYKISGWIKSENTSGDSNHGAHLSFLTSNSAGASAGSVLIGSYYAKVNTDWTYVESYYTTAATAASAHIEARVYGHTGPATLAGDFYFDNIKVVEVTNETLTSSQVLDYIKNERKYYTSTATTGTLPTNNAFTLCVFDQSQNISGIDQKDLSLNNKDSLQMNSINLNTDGMMTNKTQPAKTVTYNSKVHTVLDTGIDVKVGDLIKVYGTVKTSTSGYSSANGYFDNGERKGNFQYKVGADGILNEGSEYQIIRNVSNTSGSKRLFVSLNDADGVSNNDGELTVEVTPILYTNSVRENNNLYVKTRKNIDNLIVNIKESTDNGVGNNYVNLPSTPSFKVGSVFVDKFNFSSEKVLSTTLNNADAIAIDGTYVYTLKGNKLNVSGTNINGTTEGLSSTYTLNKDLTGVKSLVAHKGVIYAGYSDIGLCDRVSKITLNSGLNATVESIKLSTCLLDYDLGDIDGKKISKTNYSLSSDGEYVYSLSYLAGNQTNGNNEAKDLGYRIRIFDPENGFSLVKDTLVPTIRSTKDGTAVVSTKVGYYTEGFVVDENYIYVIQKLTTGTDTKVIVINKTNFTFNNSFTLQQDFTTCQSASSSSNTYSCPKSGGWNYLTDEFVFLSTNANTTKLSYYKANRDDLQNILLPSSIEFKKNEKYLISYNYNYTEFLRTNIGLSTYNNKETINSDSLVVTKGYKMSNQTVEAVIGDKVSYSNGNPFNDGNGGLYNLVRKDGNSKTIRKNSVGLNSFRFEGALVGGGKKNIVFGNNYGTVTDVTNDSYTIKGDRDDNGIVPTIKYYYKSADIDAVSVDVTYRNDTKQDKVYSANMLFGLNSVDSVKNSSNVNASNTVAETKYLSLISNNTDDNLSFLVSNGSNAKLYYDLSTDTVRVGMDNISIPAGKSATYTFHIGSYLDTETNEDLYNRISNLSSVNSIGNLEDLGTKEIKNVDLNNLELNVVRGDKTIATGVGAGANNQYMGLSDSVNGCRYVPQTFYSTSFEDPVVNTGSVYYTTPVYEDSFESPYIGTSYKYFSSMSAVEKASFGWTVVGNIVVVGYGYVFGNQTYNGANALGIQMQGSIERTINFPEDADYTFNWYDTIRPAGGQQYNVLLDGVQIATYTPTLTTYTQRTVTIPVTAGNHILKFVGTQTADKTTFIDWLKITYPKSSSVVKTYSSLTGSEITDFGWSSTGNVSKGALLNYDGSSLSLANTPNGNQSVVLKNDAEISRDFNVTVAGTYKLNWSSVGHSIGNNTYDLVLDGVVVGTYTPSSTTSFVDNTYTTELTVGNHNIKFVGKNSYSLAYTKYNVPAANRTSNAGWWQDANYMADKSILASTTSWHSQAPNGIGTYLQMDLGSVKNVAGVVTKGRGNAAQWTTSYLIAYSNDGINFTYANNAQPYVGNVDQNTEKYNVFDEYIPARYIRIYPQAAYGHSVLRADVLVESTFAKANVPGASRTTNSFYNHVYHNPDASELTDPYGWATTVANGQSQGAWLQLDLGSEKPIIGVATAGRGTLDAYQWVTSYKVAYSTDGTNFTYLNSGNNFTGNSDNLTEVYNTFPQVNARYVRIYPQGYYSHTVMRADVLLPNTGGGTKYSAIDNINLTYTTTDSDCDNTHYTYNDKVGTNFILPGFKMKVENTVVGSGAPNIYGSYSYVDGKVKIIPFENDTVVKVTTYTNAGANVPPETDLYTTGFDSPDANYNVTYNGNVLNDSFENPVLSANQTLAYSAMNATQKSQYGWVGTGSNFINKNGSAYGMPAAPDGTQAMALQGSSVASKELNFPVNGNYTLTWKDVGRPATGGNSYDVLFDDEIVATYTGSSISNSIYNTRTVTLTGVTAGNHTIKFVGGETQNSTFFYLGREVAGWYANGAIDELGLWNKILSPSEVSTLYNGGNSTPYSSLGTLSGKLLSYYGFEGVPGNTQLNTPAGNRTTNSQYPHPYHYVGESVMTAAYGWASAVPDGKSVGAYLQIDMGFTTPIVGVVTAGRGTNDAVQYVSSYKIAYSTDGTNYTYLNSGNDFVGNTSNAAITNTFPEVNARYVRIYPQSYYSHTVMRADVLIPGVLANVPAANRTTNSLYSSAVHYADKSTMTDPNGWASAVPNAASVGAWLQLDLGVSKTVYGVVTTGHGASTCCYVSSYTLAYSNDGVNFTSINSGNTFPGNTSAGNGTRVTNGFAPVNARYVRIYPQGYYGHAVMRADLLTDGTVAGLQDSTANSRHGTNYGSIIGAGKSGDGIQFTGGQYAALPFGYFSGLRTFSMSWWQKSISGGPNGQYDNLIRTDWLGSSRCQGGSTVNCIWGSPLNGGWLNIGTVGENVYNHMVVTMGEGVGKVYKNNVLVGTYSPITMVDKTTAIDSISMPYNYTLQEDKAYSSFTPTELTNYGWTSGGNSGSGIILAYTGRLLGFTNTIDGSQMTALKNDSYIEKSFTISKAGEYNIYWSDLAHTNNNTYNVLVDNVVRGTFTPSSTTTPTSQKLTVSLMPGTHTFRFAGTLTGNKYAGIDNVSIKYRNTEDMYDNWVVLGSPKEYYNAKIGGTIDFSVREEYTYKITSNKIVSVLMDNFYEDIDKNGSTVTDNTQAYDSQNGSDFMIYLPGSKDKKGNLYIAGYNKTEDITVKIEDLTNNKFNVTADLLGLVGGGGGASGSLGNVETIISPMGPASVNPDSGTTFETKPIIFDVLANDKSKYLNVSSVSLDGWGSSTNYQFIYKPDPNSDLLKYWNYGTAGAIYTGYPTGTSYGINPTLTEGNLGTSNRTTYPCYIKTSGVVSCSLGAKTIMLPDGASSSSSNWSSFIYNDFNGPSARFLNKPGVGTTIGTTVQYIDVPKINNAIKLLSNLILTEDGKLYRHNDDNTIVLIGTGLVDIAYTPVPNIGLTIDKVAYPTSSVSNAGWTPVTSRWGNYTVLDRTSATIGTTPIATPPTQMCYMNSNYEGDMTGLQWVGPPPAISSYYGNRYAYVAVGDNGDVHEIAGNSLSKINGLSNVRSIYSTPNGTTGFMFYTDLMNVPHVVGPSSTYRPFNYTINGSQGCRLNFTISDSVLPFTNVKKAAQIFYYVYPTYQGTPKTQLLILQENGNLYSMDDYPFAIDNTRLSNISRWTLLATGVKDLNSRYYINNLGTITTFNGGVSGWQIYGDVTYWNNGYTKASAGGVGGLDELGDITGDVTFNPAIATNSAGMIYELGPLAANYTRAYVDQSNGMGGWWENNYSYYVYGYNRYRSAPTYENCTGYKGNGGGSNTNINQEANCLASGPNGLDDYFEVGSFGGMGANNYNNWQQERGYNTMTRRENVQARKKVAGWVLPNIDTFTQGKNGTVVLENGKLKYTPNNGFVGIDTFEYTGKLGTTTVTVKVKPISISTVLNYNNVGEGQILHITAFKKGSNVMTEPRAVTITYGLGDSPAMSEHASPNARQTIFPTRGTSYPDYKIYTYSYNQSNAASIYNTSSEVIADGTIGESQKISSGATNNGELNTWFQSFSNKLHGTVAGNESSSVNYSYPVKSSDQYYGVGTFYKFFNPVANKIVLVGDEYTGAMIVKVTNTTDNISNMVTLPGRSSVKISITPNKSYTVEPLNAVDNTKKYYVYLQNGENVRNTFATVYRSRTSDKLTDRDLKESLADKYVKYNIIGDFENVSEDPIDAGNIDTKSNAVLPSTNTIVNGSSNITNISLNTNEKVVFNGANGLCEENSGDRDNYQLDALDCSFYTNGYRYLTYQTPWDNTNKYGAIFSDTNGDSVFKFLGGGLKNNSGSTISLRPMIADSDYLNNGPNALWKKYSSGAYLPEIPWDSANKYVNVANNEFEPDINQQLAFAKRNYSNTWFNSTIFVNSQQLWSWSPFSSIVVEASLTNGSYSNDFVDTYKLPITRTVGTNEIDYLELNTNTEFTFERAGATNGVICLTIQDNNKGKKNICYTNSLVPDGSERTDLSYLGKTINIGDAIDTIFSRNIFNDYKLSFTDGTTPVRVIAIEFTGLKQKWMTYNDYITIFSKIKFKNFTDVNSSLSPDINKNIVKPNTPFTHSLEVGKLALNNGSQVFNAQGATYTGLNGNVDQGFVASTEGNDVSVNGDFENSSAIPLSTTQGWLGGSKNAAHWNWGGWNGAGTISVGVEDGALGVSGQNILHIKLTNGGYVESRNDATGYFGTGQNAIKPNTQYKISGWIKATNVTGSSANGASIAFLTANSAGNSAGESSITPTQNTSNTWQYFEKYYTTSATAQFGHLEARVYGHTGPGNLGGDFYFDNLKLVEMVSSTVSADQQLRRINDVNTNVNVNNETKLLGSALYTVGSKKDYIVTFNALGYGKKRLRILGDTTGKVYLDTYFNTVLYTGNKIGDYDIGDEYRVIFKTDLGNNEKVKLEFTSNAGDIAVSNATIYTLDGTQFTAPSYSELQGDFTTGNAPVMSPDEKQYSRASENTWQTVFYRNDEANTGYVGNYFDNAGTTLLPNKNINSIGSLEFVIRGGWVGGSFINGVYNAGVYSGNKLNGPFKENTDYFAYVNDGYNKGVRFRLFQLGNNVVMRTYESKYFDYNTYPVINSSNWNNGTTASATAATSDSEGGYGIKSVNVSYVTDSNNFDWLGNIGNVSSLENTLSILNNRNGYVRAYIPSSMRSSNSELPGHEAKNSLFENSQPFATSCQNGIDCSAYLQMDLGKVTSVEGVITWGRQDAPYNNQRVKAYYISYSSDGINYTYSDNKKLYLGNSDNVNAHESLLEKPIKARYIRIYPQSFENWTSMKADVLISSYENAKASNYTIQYVPDSNVVSFVGVQGDLPYNIKGITEGYTNVYAESNKTIQMRIGLNGIFSVNGNIIYKNVGTEQSGCVLGTESNGGYSNIEEKNSILFRTCLVEIPLNKGNNKLSFVSIDKNSDSSFKGLYKNIIFNAVQGYSDISREDTVSYSMNSGFEVRTNSFIPFNNTDNASVNITNSYITLGKSSGEYAMTSVNNVSRSYANKKVPYITRERQFESLFNGTKINILSRGYFDTTKYAIGSSPNGQESTPYGTFLSTNGLTSNGFANFGIDLNQRITVTKNDAIEVFIKFKNEMPKTMRLAINNNNGTINNWTRLEYGVKGVYGGEETDGGDKTKYMGGLDSYNVDEWYRIVLPLSYGNMSITDLHKIYLDIAGKTISSNTRIEIGDVSILKNYTTYEGGNVKVTFDVEPISNNKNELEFVIGNSLNDHDFAGYKVIYSRNANDTCLYKNNNELVSCVANDDSKFSDDKNNYKFGFIKSGKYIAFVSSYTFNNNGKTETKVTPIIITEDANPIQLDNAKIFFKTKNGQHKISNINILDGEDGEIPNYVHIQMTTDGFNGEGLIRLTNEFGETYDKAFAVNPTQTDYYIAIDDMASYRGRLTDVEVIPNNDNANRERFLIKNIELIKESETPSIIAENLDEEILGKSVVKKGSNVYEYYQNTKERVMGYTVFVKKVKPGSYTEGLTLRLFQADKSLNIDYNTLLAEKTISTDSIDSVSVKGLKITFPSVELINGQYYAVELSTENADGYQVYGNNKNEYIEGYALQNKTSHPEQEGWEFNNLGLNVVGTKGANGYLGSNPLVATNVPVRESINADNMSIRATATVNNGFATIPDHVNTKLRSEFSIMFNGTFPTSLANGTKPMIFEKRDNSNNLIYGAYIENDNSISFKYKQKGAAGVCTITTGSDNGTVYGSMQVTISYDPSNEIIKVYYNNSTHDVFQMADIGRGISGAVLAGNGSVDIDNCTPNGIIDDNGGTIKVMGGHAGFGTDMYDSTNSMSIDYLRLYDFAISDESINSLTNPMSLTRYTLPYDIGLYAVTLSSEVSSLEERTYDLGENIVREVDGDLYLDGYDSGDGVKELLLKGNITFRVKGNIYINADKIYVLDDKAKTGDSAISYIGFVSDKDIIINSNTDYIEGGFFARGSIKTVPSDKQLKVKGLLAGNEIDLQNRTYMGTNFNPSSGANQEDSVVIEFDNRIYKRMPPLFYESNDKKGIAIKEE